MLSKRHAVENEWIHTNEGLSKVDGLATSSLEGTQKEQFRVLTRSRVLCDLRVEVQRDIGKLLEVQPVPKLREGPCCDDKDLELYRLVTLFDAKAELRSKLF